MNLRDSSLIEYLAYAFLSLAVLNTLSGMFLSDLNLWKVLKLREAIHRTERFIEIEREKNTHLKRVYGKLKKDPEFFKKKLVREYLLMFREGEKVVPLPKELWYKQRP
ncbi:MAG TPA: hypothetical protein EYH49_04720 [Aquifex aeolicus]|nr:hypothetical protein [Aquifex aeolicus]